MEDIDKEPSQRWLLKLPDFLYKHSRLLKVGLLWTSSLTPVKLSSRTFC
jgi:hypothetical protein